MLNFIRGLKSIYGSTAAAAIVVLIAFVAISYSGIFVLIGGYYWVSYIAENIMSLYTFDYSYFSLMFLSFMWHMFSLIGYLSLLISLFYLIGNFKNTERNVSNVIARVSTWGALVNKAGSK